jgi:hypothetical protein
MKRILIAIAAVGLIAGIASCSKSDTAASGRDAFIGNYAMNDTIIYKNQTGSASFRYDTTVKNYTMVVLPIAGTTDKVIFNNANNIVGSDTATISGNVASFTVSQGNRPAAATATLNGKNISLAGGTIYATDYYTVYAVGKGTKQ